MADDQLYEESNESLSDQLLDAASGVVAAGTAAASFYRMGGARYISRQYSRYAREFRTIRNEIKRLDYYRVNKDSLKELLGKNGKIRTTWRDYKPTEERLAEISIRPGTTMELLADFLRRNLEADSTRRSLLFSTQVTDNVKKFAEEQIKRAVNMSDPAKHQMRMFAKLATEHVKSVDDMKKFAVKNAIGKSPLLAAHQDIAHNIMMSAIAYNDAFKTWLKNHPDTGIGPAEDIQKILLESAMRNGRQKTADTATDTILGDRRARLGEVLDNLDKFAHHAKIYYKDADGAQKSADFLDELKKFADQTKESNEKLYNSLRDVHLDSFLRTDGHEFYSFMPIADLKNETIRQLSGTLPAKILKLRSFDMSERTPLFVEFRKGALNASIAEYERKKNLPTGISHRDELGSNYYYINGNMYRYDLEKDALSGPIKELSNMQPVSSRFGPESNLLNDMYGYNLHRAQAEGSLGARVGMFDSSETRFTERLENLLRGQSDPYNVKTILQNYNKVPEADVVTRYNNMVRVNELLQEHAGTLTPSMLRAIHEGFSIKYKDGTEKVLASKDMQNILALLENSTESNQETTAQLLEALERLQGEKTARSPYLQKLLNSLHTNQLKAENSAEIVENLEQEYNNGAKRGMSFREQLQKGLSQEFIIRFAEEAGGEKEGFFSVIKDIIENQTSMSEGDMQKAKNFAYTTLLDFKTTGIMRQSAARNSLFSGDLPDERVMEGIELFENLAGGKYQSEGSRDVTKMIHDFAADYSDVLSIRKRDSRMDFQKQYADDDYFLIKKSAGPMSVIGAVNEAIKQSSAEPIKDNILEFWNQLKAGRDNPGDISRLTMTPYFFLSRLGDNEVLSFLQFSNKEKQSTLGLAKGLAKRIGIAAVGATYLDWANDTVGAVTGTSPAAGIVNSLDYMDIGVRKLFDVTGIGGILQNQMEANPIMQYWFGKDGYFTAEQQRDQYANGYEPVRRGRYWDFGSVNEFRGAQIQYYEPTLTRRLNSDYYDKSLYSGYWDKWGHSLLPTPTAPLSPLMYILDPYYLENEHSEDRPYAVTGTMFQKDTPWGIVLNPTIGQLIKPVQRMHQDRLTDDGRDAKAIIYGINRRIRDVASGDHAYSMVFDREQITAGEYTSYTNPSMGEYVIDIGRSVGQDQRQKQIETLGNGPMELERREMLYEPSGSYGSGGFLSSLFGDSSGGGIGSTAAPSAVSANAGSDDGGFLGIGGGSGSGGGTSPLDLLGQTNRRIYQAAARNSNTGGILTNDRIRHFRMDDVLLADDSRQLIGEGTNANLGDQASRSFRLISGIYGYGANRAFGFGEYEGRQIADSGDIDSFSRSFWDEGLGGLGGGTAEIARRFIPEYRRSVRYNPLLNSLPDWLPEQFRFGDAYSNLPKGEARLPGKGYEALNALHPDKYGRYICRIKNARIAGNSLESCLPIMYSNVA